MVFNEVDALKLNMEGNLSVAIEWRRLQARRRITSWWTRTVAIVAVVADRWFRNRPFNHIINRCVYWFVNQLVIDASISHFQELVRQDRRELSLVERRLIYQTLFNRDIGKKKNKCFFLHQSDDYGRSPNGTVKLDSRVCVRPTSNSCDDFLFKCHNHTKKNGVIMKKSTRSELKSRTPNKPAKWLPLQWHCIVKTGRFTSWFQCPIRSTQ